jgi:predicted nuclease of predicted toxin-antitoxin system
MKFLLDQDIYAVTARFLADAGYDIILAAEIGLSQASDEEILRIAQEQNRILITRDRVISKAKKQLKKSQHIVSIACSNLKLCIIYIDLFCDRSLELSELSAPDINFYKTIDFLQENMSEEFPEFLRQGNITQTTPKILQFGEFNGETTLGKAFGNAQPKKKSQCLIAQ